MKKFYFLFFLSLTLFALAVVVVSRIHHSTEETIAQKEGQWNKEKQNIQDELAEVSAKIEELKTQKTELDNPELDPQTLIARLQKMKDWSEFFGNNRPLDESLRRQALDQVREAFFVFQGLQNQGKKSLDTIEEYLKKGHNITLYRYIEPVDPNNPPVAHLRTAKQMENVPETSRLGMIHVLGKIGTPEALKLLCQVMTGSADLKEIMNAGDMLIVADKEGFSKTVLDICKALYPTLDRGNQEELLIYVRNISVESYKEMLASLTLYDENGKIFSDNVRKKIEIFGEDAIPEIYEAFNRPETSKKEKSDILEPLLKFVGSNEQVTSMFSGFINSMDNDEKDAVGSIFVMMFLATNEQNKEKQQQYLDLLDQWIPQQGEQSIFSETLALTRKGLSQQIEQGEKFNKEEFEKDALASGVLQKMVKNQLEFFQKHPEWNGFSFYPEF
jgi:hypothetical protein